MPDERLQFLSRYHAPGERRRRALEDEVVDAPGQPLSLCITEHLPRSRVRSVSVVQRGCEHYTTKTGGVIVLYVFQSIPKNQLLSGTEWNCSDDSNTLRDEDFDQLRGSLGGPFYVKTENYLSGNFTNQMEECFNAEDKREEREKIVID